MKTELMTMWYNEEDLAPFFLKHYSWVDKVHLILDSDTNDNTERIASQYTNVVIDSFTFPDMMDDNLKVCDFNRKYRDFDCDWVILVDSDEFIFNRRLGANFTTELQEALDHVIFCQLWNVYRHITEQDLDVNKPISEQRSHGVKHIFGCDDSVYLKPSIVRGNIANIAWLPGHHCVDIDGERAIPRNILPGSHWAMADVEIAVKRRIYGRKMRQSHFNLTHGLGFQHHHITEEEIREECKQHENDPKIF